MVLDGNHRLQIYKQELRLEEAHCLFVWPFKTDEMDSFISPEEFQILEAGRNLMAATNAKMSMILILLLVNFF